MKLILKLIAISCCFVFLATTNGFALPLLGDATSVTMNSSDNRPYTFAGGEFTLITDLDEKYAAFCVEWEEHIQFNNEYTIDSVADYANKGGGIDNGAGWVGSELRDPLSIKTKWLMNAYVNGDLKDRYSLHDKRDLGGAMQVAIWTLEGEDYYNSYASRFGALAKELSDDAELFTQGLDDDLFSNVKVVNLTGAQSQIIAAAPVPEPATMILLGTGLIGIAGVGRKKLVG